MFSLANFLFLAALILVGRPLAVLLSTHGSHLNWRERAFLAWLAPRGIVAASVASVFALDLRGAGRSDAERLITLTFLVIVSTVVVYGLTAAPLARWLGVVAPSPPPDSEPEAVPAVHDEPPTRT